MRLTKKRLLQIIKEETKKVLLEQSYPTEADLNYLASLGMDEPDAPRQAVDPASTVGAPVTHSPEDVLNLRQLNMDPREYYDPDYIPHSHLGSYGPREEEEYVRVPSHLTQQFPELVNILDTNMEGPPDPNRRMPQFRGQPVGTTVYGSRKTGPVDDRRWRRRSHRDTERDHQERFVRPERRTHPSWGYEDVPTFEELPETGGFWVRQGRRKDFGVPHMEEYIRSLGNVGDGGWYIGDISKEGGGEIGGHGSHQAGADVDIALPTVGGDESPRSIHGMSTRHGRRDAGIRGERTKRYYPTGVRDEWDFRYSAGGKPESQVHGVAVDELDVDKTVQFLRHTSPRAMYIFLDPMYTPRIKTKMNELVKSGDMSPEEYVRIMGKNPEGMPPLTGETGRLAMGNRVLRPASADDVAHKNHFHVRLRGVYQGSDDRSKHSRHRHHSLNLQRRRAETQRRNRQAMRRTSTDQPPEST